MKPRLPPRTLILLIILIFLLSYLTGKLKKLPDRKGFRRYSLDIWVSQSITTIIRYMPVIVGFYIIFQITDIYLSALGFLVGALGIEIGFGFQNITNNFIIGPR